MALLSGVSNARLTARCVAYVHGCFEDQALNARCSGVSCFDIIIHNGCRGRPTAVSYSLSHRMNNTNGRESQSKRDDDDKTWYMV